MGGRGPLVITLRGRERSFCKWKYTRTRNLRKSECEFISIPAVVLALWSGYQFRIRLGGEVISLARDRDTLPRGSIVNMSHMTSNSDFVGSKYDFSVASGIAYSTKFLPSPLFVYTRFGSR